MRIDDDDLTLSLSTLKFMFGEAHTLLLWTIPLFLAVLLRLITWKYHHQLVFPVYFLGVAALFYAVVGIGMGIHHPMRGGEWSWEALREEGWLFDMHGGKEGGGGQWWSFYEYLDFELVRFRPLWMTLPTQFALYVPFFLLSIYSYIIFYLCSLFFNILHPPLNVPALSVSLNHYNINTNRELIAHGFSNMIAGLLGTVPNYLAYVNTLLFYRVGGGTRVAGFLLGVATAGIMWAGTGFIAFIRGSFLLPYYLIFLHANVR